jgi:hypothetical protein
MGGLVDMAVIAASPAPTATRRRGWLDVFPLDDAPFGDGLPARWRWPLGVVAVLIAAAVSLLNVNRPFNTVWAEDGTYFYSDILNRWELRTLVRPLQGYFVEMGRVLVVPARFVPLEWGPALMTTEAALVTALFALIVFVASRTHLRTVPGRLVAAAPMLAVPVGENFGATTADDLATLQFVGLYTVLWMLLWRPARRALKVTAFAVVLAVTLSSLLVVLLLPLAILRVVVLRDRLGKAMLATIVGGAVLNALALELHLTARPSFLIPNYDPIWALRWLFAWAIPTAMAGYRPVNSLVPWTDTPGPYAFLAIVVLAAVVAVAAWRCRPQRPQWILAGVIAAEAVILFCGATMSAGSAQPRYLVAPELMLFVALAVLLQPSLGTAARPWSTPAISLMVVVALVCAANFHLVSNRTLEPVGWTQVVARARSACQTNPKYQAVYVYPSLHAIVVGLPAGTPMAKVAPPGFPVRLPCDRLR